jgi:hypothetical protein
MSQVPIPTRKPEVPAIYGTASSSGFLDEVKNTISGVWSTGLDFLSKELEFQRQVDMLELQNKMEKQAQEANSTGTPTGAGSIAGYSMAAISPVTLALLGAAGFLFLKK